MRDPLLPDCTAAYYHEEINLLRIFSAVILSAMLGQSQIMLILSSAPAIMNTLISLNIGQYEVERLGLVFAVISVHEAKK